MCESPFHGCVAIASPPQLPLMAAPCQWSWGAVGVCLLWLVLEVGAAVAPSHTCTPLLM